MSELKKKKVKPQPLSHEEMLTQIQVEFNDLLETSGKINNAIEQVKRLKSQNLDVALAPIEAINLAIDSLKGVNPKDNLLKIQKLMLRRLNTKAKELSKVK